MPVSYTHLDVYKRQGNIRKIDGPGTPRPDMENVPRLCRRCYTCRKDFYRVQYLGHLVLAAGISTNLNKVVTLRDWPVAKSKHEVWSFLGLCSYYRRFVKGHATIGKSLHELTENKRTFCCRRSVIRHSGL